MKRILAFFHRICPFCVFARRFPRSWLVRLLAKWEPHCPFCRAAGEGKKSQD